MSCTKKINTKQLQSLKESCKVKDFKTLPITESLPDGFINHYLNSSDSIGCYWLDIDKNDNRNYSIVILSEVSRRLIVYTVVN